MRYLWISLIGFVMFGCQTSDETRVDDPNLAEAETEIVADPEAADEKLAIDDPTQSAVPATTHGAEVYARVCVTCHGKLGDGRGMEMKLFGFDAPADQWKNGPSVEGITTTLEEGIHHSSMKSFEYYSEGDRKAVAQYVLELRERLLAAEEDSSSQSTEK